MTTVFKCFDKKKQKNDGLLLEDGVISKDEIQTCNHSRLRCEHNN